MRVSVQLVDEVHLARSVMLEEVCGRPLMVSWYAFLDG